LPAPADISPFENNGPVEDAGSSRLGKKQYGIRPHLKITCQLLLNYNAQGTLQTCVDILSRRFVKAGIGRHVEISVREDLCRVHPEIIEPWHYSDQAKKGTSTVAERMNTMSTARPATPAPTTTTRVDLFEPETEEDETKTPTEVDAHLATPTAGDNERVAEAPADPAEAVGDNERVANSSTSTTAANEWTNDRI
jgi:hypothetical protein